MSTLRGKIHFVATRQIFRTLENKWSGEKRGRRVLNEQPASDEVHRTVSLGLTLGEARAWYMNHVLMPQIRSGLVAVAAGLIMLASMLSPLGELLEGTLVTHMIVQHFLFLAAGVLLGYGIGSSILVAS